MPWDPDHYLRFANQRIRPGLELAARIPDIEARHIVDLGSGTGRLTAHLAARWPEASVVGVDSSVEMVDRARLEHPELKWVVADIANWRPDQPVDLLFSNATLHWLDNHDELFPRFRSHVSPGGAVAVQMPDNWQEPTHSIPTAVLDEGDWPEAARSAWLRDRLSSPASYARWIQPADVDLWRTTYYHPLTGDDPVWNWVTGTALRPVLAALEGADEERFARICRDRYAQAYPPGPDGITTLPFSRLFFVAQTR